MAAKNITNDSSWPKPDFKIGAWIGSISGIITVALFAFPSLQSDPSLDSFRFTAVAVLVGSVVVVPLGIWVTQLGKLTLVRARAFPKLKDELYESLQKVESLTRQNGELARLLVLKDSLEIVRCEFWKNCVLLDIKPKRGVVIEKDDVLLLVDKTDYAVLGSVIVTERSTRLIKAKSMSDADQLWLGFVKEAGESALDSNLVVIPSVPEKSDE